MFSDNDKLVIKILAALAKDRQPEESVTPYRALAKDIEKKPAG